MRPTFLQKAPQISPIFTPDKITLHVSREKDKEIALGRCRMGRCESRSAGRLRASSEGSGRWSYPPQASGPPSGPLVFHQLKVPLTRIEPSTFRISFLTPVMRNGPHLCREHARRPMVTIIRASRARCVNATIPRHERAVLTARHPARAGRAPGTGSDGAPTWPKCWHKSAVRASTGD